jgi:peptidoglycan glycosyltransferase
MVVAALVTSGGYVLASFGRTASIPAALLPFILVVLGLFALAHLATRRLAPGADATLLPIAAVLNGVGYVFIARLDQHLASLQAVWTALGVAAFVATLFLVKRVRDLERFRYSLALIGIALLLLPLTPVLGQNINGARLWVRLAGVSFQPVELAKIALAVFFASYLVERRELLALGTRRVGGVVIPSLRHFGPILLAWGISLLIMTAERDIGFSLLFFVLFVGMVWVATGRTAYIVSGAGLFGAGAVIASRLFAHVNDRVRIWINPWPYASGKGYQLTQAMFSMAAGGVAGTGLALGSPQRIPVVASDFIFAAIGEELGLAGTTAILVCFLLLVGAGLRIALRAEQPFEKLLSAGLTAVLGFQAFVIMAGVTRLLPLTGVTLPFVSYGGSSLIANYVLLALLMRISEHHELPAAET